jgi:hypothetical protein
MENFDMPLDIDQQASYAAAAPEGLELSPKLRRTWWETAGWMRFSSIALYISLAFMVLYTFTLLYLLSNIRYIPFPASYKMLLIFIIFLSCITMGFQALYMGQFATALRNSLRYEATDWLEFSAEKLLNYYKTYGYTLIAVLVFTVLTVFYLTFTSVPSPYDGY